MTEPSSPAPPEPGTPAPDDPPAPDVPAAPAAEPTTAESQAPRPRDTPEQIAALLPKPTDRSLLVIEVYASIQGETTFAGIPFVLVRLARCNLRCVWCDSTFTFRRGTPWSVPTLLAEVRSHLLPHVLVTGGEPLLQPAVHPFLKALCDEEYTVLLETSGAEDIGSVDPRVRRIMDLKCPGSGEEERNRWSNVQRLTVTDEVKFVIADRADYEWARTVIRRERLSQRVGAILLSPVFGDPELPRQIAAWLLEDRLPARLQIQVHKFVWDPKERRR